MIQLRHLLKALTYTLPHNHVLLIDLWPALHCKVIHFKKSRPTQGPARTRLQYGDIVHTSPVQHIMLLNAMPRRIPVLARHVLLRHSLRKLSVVTNHAASHVKPPQAANANQRPQAAFGKSPLRGNGDLRLTREVWAHCVVLSF